MRCLLFATILAALAATAHAADCPVKPPSHLAQSGALTFGTTNPPAPDGVTVPPQQGLEEDLVRALAGTMCLKPQFTALAFAGLFPALNAQKFEAAIAGIGVTAEREKSFDFVPYLLGGMRMVVRKDSGRYFKSEADVCGFRIAALAGSVQARDLEKYKSGCPQDKPMDVVIYPTNNEIAEQLRKGTVQVVFFDWSPAAAMVERNPQDFALGSPILSGEPPGEPRHRVAIMVRKGDAQVKAAIEQALAAIQKNGTYDSLLAKWGLQEGDIRKG
jgi:ABC-type amino acid transport substrate-binding protein